MTQANSKAADAALAPEGVEVVPGAPTLEASGIDFEALSASLTGLEGKLDKNPKTAAIIMAGGSGDRFGREGGKQLVPLGGVEAVAVAPRAGHVLPSKQVVACAQIFLGHSKICQGLACRRIRLRGKPLVRHELPKRYAADATRPRHFKHCAKQGKTRRVRRDVVEKPKGNR